MELGKRECGVRGNGRNGGSGNCGGHVLKTK